MRGAVTGSGRIGGFDVASSRGSVQSAATHVDPPKYRTVISIQPDNWQPSRRSPAAVRSACPPPPSDVLGVINGPAKRVPVDGADPDETESVASWASSSDRTPRMDRRRQNGHARSPSSSASSSASPAASNRLRTPGSYLSPTSPRREAATNATDDQLVDHPFFALFRDAPYEEESQILSGRGTVRGVRHRVKSGIAVFVEKRDATCQKVRLKCILHSYAGLGYTTPYVRILTYDMVCALLVWSDRRIMLTTSLSAEQLFSLFCLPSDSVNHKNISLSITKST